VERVDLDMANPEGLRELARERRLAAAAGPCDGDARQS